MNEVELKYFKTDRKAIIPSYAHAGDSGADVYSIEDCVVPPHGNTRVPTGIGAVIPDGYEIQVRPRSGLMAKKGIVCGFGTVDSSYRKEIGVILFNHTDIPYLVQAGDRVAQLVLSPVVRVRISEVDLAAVDDTGRGGFGSTGR